MSVHPTDLLRQEHELVRLVAGAMEREVAIIEQTREVRRVRVARMVDFARHFTDGRHHRKEEELLFSLLRERNAGVDAAIGTMLSEHGMGRAAIRAVDAALDEGEHDDDGPEIIAVNLGVYAGLVRLHMAKEEVVLFPLAERLLSVREMEMLGEEFERLEALEDGRGESARYEALARELAGTSADDGERGLLAA
jgi:hemerythrin-like domain-containing protein